MALEWPQYCSYWGLPRVVALAKELNLREVTFNGCSLGLRGNQGGLIKKPWKVITNSGELIRSLGKLKCTKDHPHEDCAGRNTKQTENYTMKLHEVVHKAFSREAQARIGVGFLCHAPSQQVSPVSVARPGSPLSGGNLEEMGGPGKGGGRGSQEPHVVPQKAWNWRERRLAFDSWQQYFYQAYTSLCACFRPERNLAQSIVQIAKEEVGSEYVRILTEQFSGPVDPLGPPLLLLASGRDSGEIPELQAQMVRVLKPPVLDAIEGSSLYVIGDSTLRFRGWEDKRDPSNSIPSGDCFPELRQLIKGEVDGAIFRGGGVDEILGKLRGSVGRPIDNPLVVDARSGTEPGHLSWSVGRPMHPGNGRRQTKELRGPRVLPNLRESHCGLGRGGCRWAPL